MNDQAVIKAIRRGDIQAFESLFRTYYEMLCKWAFQYMHDKDSAEEVVQDLFYHLWKDRASLSIDRSLKSYLYKAVSNNCKHRLRTVQRRTAIQAELARGPQNRAAEPSEELAASEMNEIVNQTLDDLPERAARVFRMSRYEGLKYREIAEKLSISVKTVEANMGKALERFRKNLGDHIE